MYSMHTTCWESDHDDAKLCHVDLWEGCWLNAHSVLLLFK